MGYKKEYHLLNCQDVETYIIGSIHK